MFLSDVDDHARKIADERFRDDGGERVGADGLVEFPVVLHAGAWHGIEVNVEAEGGAEDADDENRPGDAKQTEAGGAHGGDLAVGGEAAEREEHAGEHAHG